ncbi:F0F1 ATP synthase subunit epsilon [Planctomycetota bacterium]
MATSTKTFQCVVVAPHGKLVDAPARSVVFPAHDGQRGVMADHSPMFCKLGVGIMEMETTDEATGLIDRERVLVDGGFAVICENQLKVVSYDVIHPLKSDPEAIDALQRRLRKDLDSGSLDSDIRRSTSHKLNLLEHLLASV